MGDHFVLLVDRLLTESTLEAAIYESRNLAKQSTDGGGDDIDQSSYERDSRECSSPRKIVECRICQDEGENSNMDTPCSCCGSLKYAHRRCIQRWCNEKGNTVCEICSQPFKPGYTAPPPMFQLGQIPVNFRGNWEISRRDLNNHRFIAVVSPDLNFIDPVSDEHASSTARSEFCCRSIAMIFMVLLVLRHVCPVIFSGMVDYSVPSFLVLLLRACGVILPIYIILRAVYAIQSYRRHQVSPEISDSSDEEAGLPTLLHQARVMRVH